MKNTLSSMSLFYLRLIILQLKKYIIELVFYLEQMVFKIFFVQTPDRRVLAYSSELFLFRERTLKTEIQWVNIVGPEARII